MITQEENKLERIREIRKKREAKKQAKLRAKRRNRIAALITLSAVTVTVLGTMYTASAKEITITEINEFTGYNESKTVITRQESVEDVLEEHGLNVGEADKLNVPTEKEVTDNDDIIITRGKRVTIKADECEAVVTITKANLTDALVEAGYIPGEYDQISKNGVAVNDGDSIKDGDTIELVAVSHTDEVVSEPVEHGVEYIDDPDLPKGQEKVVDEGRNGVKEITHKVTYKNGEEAQRETTGEDITVAPKNKIIARGTATPTPKATAAPAKSGSGSKSLSGTRSSVSDTGGTVNGHKYKKKITMTATAYSTSASENGGYTVSAMGNPLGYGIVAVDPNVIPLGSTVYVTAADGSWTYGVASAEDTGGAIKGNKIDLCYPSNAMDFGRRSCVVYVLE